jgi:hypothetical protein
MGKLTALAPLPDNFHEEIPEPLCSCGVYAAKHYQHLIDINYGRYGIHGEVALWGKIVECTLGYRAQYAYPKFFVIPPNMMPFNMGDAEIRLKSLIDFDVDIYVQKENVPSVDAEKLPLWVKDYGFSSQGLDWLTQRCQRWYNFRILESELQVGDRLSIKDKGIAIVTALEGDEACVTLFNRTVYRMDTGRIVWNDKNNRWETDAIGAYVTAATRPALGTCDHASAT